MKIYSDDVATQNNIDLITAEVKADILRLENKSREEIKSINDRLISKATILILYVISISALCLSLFGAFLK